SERNCGRRPRAREGFPAAGEETASRFRRCPALRAELEGHCGLLDDAAAHCILRGPSSTRPLGREASGARVCSRRAGGGNARRDSAVKPVDVPFLLTMSRFVLGPAYAASIAWLGLGAQSDLG